MAMQQLKDVKRVVILYRLSKPKKGNSKEQTEQLALGLKAQKAFVHRVLAASNPKIIREIKEIEKATRATGDQLKNRPELREALDLCKATNATLVISAVDRLVRKMGFLNWMIDQRVPFFVADCPDMNNMEVQFKGLLADNEGVTIGQRTRAALAAAKAENPNLKLGAARPRNFHNGYTDEKGVYHEPNAHLRGSLAGCIAMAKARQDRAFEKYEPMFPELRQMLKEELSYGRMADRLNDLDYRTTRDTPFIFQTVQKIVKRYEEKILNPEKKNP